MNPPRVLLVDDDPVLRRFVSLALEDLAIDLATAASVAEALALLRAGGPVQLLLTDLMMPGASGFDLLQALADAPALRGAASLVVLSAGLDAAAQGRLAALGVDQALHKPITLDALLGCVHRATGLAGPARPAPTAPVAPASSSRPRLDAAEQAALQRHFGGDVALFVGFRASCRAQFGLDLAQGHRALAAADAPGLRRLAHNLKSVLANLGADTLAALARQLEAAASDGDWPRAAALWAPLQEGLADQAERGD